MYSDGNYSVHRERTGSISVAPIGHCGSSVTGAVAQVLPRGALQSQNIRATLPIAHAYATPLQTDGFAGNQGPLSLAGP